jgi:Sugar-transfer associated ATP-grasp
MGAAIWHTGRSVVQARKTGRPYILQLLDQLRIYAGSGIMPATYYIFSLTDEPTVGHARSFLKRAETKGSIYPLVQERMRPSSSLNDKQAFEARCTANGLPVVPTLAVASRGRFLGNSTLPEQDIFIKPLAGKGGRGAERWEWVGEGRYRDAQNRCLTIRELRDHVLRRSRRLPFIVQPRITNHPSLESLNCGALATMRILTCLDESGSPEIIGAALRMPIRPGSVVDNLHAGGIAAAVDVETGELGWATNLGKDARVGWLERHPLTGALIAGRRLQWWPKARDLALRGHRHFDDRLFIGWDIAMTDRGPLIVEANGAPDLDILQRSSRSGMCKGRFAELLAARVSHWGACGCPMVTS